MVFSRYDTIRACNCVHVPRSRGRRQHYLSDPPSNLKSFKLVPDAAVLQGPSVKPNT